MAYMKISHHFKPLYSKVFAVFGLAGAFLSPFELLAAPRLPTDPGEILERLPMRPGDATARELASLRAAVMRAARENPATTLPATRLAERYYDLAVARGDPRYVGYANAVMAPYAQSQAPAVLAVRGQLRQYRHDFDGALADFANALKADPQFAAAHAWRGAVYLVQAKYPAAEAECVALQALGRDTLYGGCIGLVRAYSGQMEAGFAALQRALDAADETGNRLWLLTRLGEVAAWRGQAAKAEQYYRRALALGLEDGYLLAAWSDFLLDQKRHAEVVKLLASWEASDGLLLRLAIAETALKLPSALAHTQALADRFAAARMRGDTTHRAEEARYELHLAGNTAAALAVAAANYNVQREPRDARALLEAAIAARDAPAAQPVRNWLQSSGFEDMHLQQLGVMSAQVPPAASETANLPPNTMSSPNTISSPKRKPEPKP